MRESASKSMNQPRSQFVSNMAAYWGGFEDKDDAHSCMSCLDTTKYRCLRCKFPMCNKSWKCWKFVAHCVPSLKEAFEQGTQYSTHAVGCFRSFWSKGSIFTVSFKKERALFWARACLLYILLKLINYSCTDDPIRLLQFGQVHGSWYPMNIQIKSHPMLVQKLIKTLIKTLFNFN